ncbi:aldo/keto reductase [Companilactobacillus sp.]|jgi:predicted oxidoreductase|uniref:aldo/keto reductase n=1 Tax=Companilactobacillus sp. TaxID=2767905 RepID=UPI0025BFB170|nr:aldo/keto reductase [Companilactobacillus sp.]MCH4008542.1 aldo/keto reductase [Companilactobacillus sp.]MCH4051279.1 aldo/keto reductase [Companilactobacillus sp.]MCH4076485.1 aldo/keto reductase [Companilactobacillus sp.]MCH4125060.1 aldo/keto reductase [Companilactobacillus sp.]MCH4131601.1 aldo/keto reductase [Companilactobacillus sp.]
MKQVNIGNTNWKTSAVALGIMRMEALSPADAAKALDAAYDTGIDYIDSADIYGMGNSEKVFGEALKQSHVNRDQLYIQSKGGIVFDPERSHGSFVFGKRYDFAKKHLIEAVDGILERMQIDYLDAFLLHRPDPLMDPAEVSAAFDELQTAGKVRHFGVSNFNPQQFEFVQENVDQKLLINQLQFSIMHTGMVDFGMHTNMTDDRSIDHDGGLLEFSRRKGTTIQTWSPFQYGMFEGTFINNDKFPELNQKLEELAKKYGVSKNGIATAWILRHPANMQVIIGTMNPDYIVDSAKGADVELTKQEWYDVYFAAGNTLP